MNPIAPETLTRLTVWFEAHPRMATWAAGFMLAAPLTVVATIQIITH